MWNKPQTAGGMGVSVTWRYVEVFWASGEGDSAEGFNQPVSSTPMCTHPPTHTHTHTHTHYVAAGAEIKCRGRDREREMWNTGEKESMPKAGVNKKGSSEGQWRCGGVGQLADVCVCVCVCGLNSVYVWVFFGKREMCGHRCNMNLQMFVFVHPWVWGCVVVWSLSTSLKHESPVCVCVCVCNSVCVL